MVYVTDEVVAEAECVVEAVRSDQRYIGRGCFKEAYWLPSKSAVIKIPSHQDYDTTRTFEFEWALYVIGQRMGFSHLFPETVWAESSRHGLYMIQEPCRASDSMSDCPTEDDDGALLEEAREVFVRFGCYDLHPGNVGYSRMDGRPVVMDWGFEPRTDGTTAERIWAACGSKSPLPQIEIQSEIEWTR